MTFEELKVSLPNRPPMYYAGLRDGAEWALREVMQSQCGMCAAGAKVYRDGGIWMHEVGGNRISCDAPRMRILLAEVTDAES